MSLSPQGYKSSMFSPWPLPPPRLSASPAPFASFIPSPPLLRCGDGAALALERGLERARSHILVAGVPSQSPQWPTFLSSLSLSPQPLHLSSLSAPLWPRLASVASATRLLLCPAPLFKCLTLHAKLTRWVKARLVSQGPGTCNLWKHKCKYP